MMSPRPSLTLFAHLVSMPEAELDLAQASLVFAESEYPELEDAYYLDVLDDLGREARRILVQRVGDTTEARVRGLLEWMYGSLGFRGNTESYYDPKNSYFNEVLDRRKGIPITLALVLLEIARRAGIEATGISFPGHFLVRAGTPDRPLVIDPFHGRILGPAELNSLAARATNEPGPSDPQKLEPCSKRKLLFRMLTNLRNIHASQNDEKRLRNVIEHLVAIAPSPELGRELQRLGGGSAFFRRSSTGRSLN
jgi:regulator of sirC expression with transglutaminase-like and TPR domain